MVAPTTDISPAFVTKDSLAYLALRKLDDPQAPKTQRWQLGAHGFGPDAEAVAARMCEAIRAWDRHGPDPHIAVYPGAAEPATCGQGETRLLVPRRHTTIVVTWPTPVSGGGR